MSENRISSYFNAASEPAPQAAPAVGQNAAPCNSLLPPIVSAVDLYQAAYARALFDHALDRLFNPDARVE